MHCSPSLPVPVVPIGSGSMLMGDLAKVWPTQDAPKPSTLLPGHRTVQVLPDPMHGLKCIVLTCLLPASKQLLQRRCVPHDSIDSLINLDVDCEDGVTTISAVLQFVRKRAYRPLVAVVHAHYRGEYLPGEGAVRGPAIGDAHSAM